MIKISMPIIVEGRYDRIKLSSIIDGVFIETGGFRIFKDKELLNSLRSLAVSHGIIIMTDSDAAGFKIRNYLKGACSKDAKLIQVYIPAIKGKEKRKEVASAEGLLGVEGLSEQQLLETFQRAGVFTESCDEIREKITTADFYFKGLTGGENSATKRRELAEQLQLPPRLSVGSFIHMLNILMTREEFLEL